MHFSYGAKARFMAVALAESRKALPACQPNPPVGCVIVHDGQVVARGFTGAPGEPHAEASAMSALPPIEDASELSVFVTLEPCSFYGRTPSCAKALIERGVGTVFVGLIDPDPRNNGAGLRLLREAGISVELGVLQAEVRTFLMPYLAGAAAHRAG